MLHQLGWRAQTDQARLFRYALALAPDPEFFIRKAIGWALRDHASTQPEGVGFFDGPRPRFVGLDAAGGRQTFGVMGGWAALGAQLTRSNCP